MRARFPVPSTLLALLVALPLFTACSDDSSGPDGANLVGTWNATSFTATGFGDLIAAGMSVQATFSASNTYTIQVTNDQLGALCETGTDCTETGPYSSTSSTITVDAGTVDATTFNYQIQGSTMTWTGNIDGTALTIVWAED